MALSQLAQLLSCVRAAPTKCSIAAMLQNHVMNNAAQKALACATQSFTHHSYFCNSSSPKKG